MSDANPQPEMVIACDLSVFTPDERDQHIELAHEIFTAVQGARELPDGFAVRLTGDSAWLYKLADFIRDDRRCCPFFTFTVVVEPQGGPIWLHLTGPEGAKEGVAEDLRELLPEPVAAAVGLR